MSESNKRNDLKLSEMEIRLLAMLTSLDLDGFMDQVAANFGHIKSLAGTAIAKAVIMAGEGVIPDCDGELKAELKAMLVLSYRCSAMEQMINSIKNDPTIMAATMQHDDAQIAQVLARCVEANTELSRALKAGEPIPSVDEMIDRTGRQP